MAKNFILIIFLALTFTGIGQILPIGYDTLAYRQEIIVQGRADYAGSAIERDLSAKFIFGGLITDEIKDRSFEKHKSVNRIGADIGAEAEYRNYSVKLFKKKDWGIVVKAGYQAFGGMVYSGDLFGLAFYGNKRYLGDTISMSGTDMSFTSFQKIGFGLVDASSKSNISLNVYNIDNRLTGHFRTLEITQPEDGSSVTINMDGEVSVQQNKVYTQGIGFGMDFDFKLPISWNENSKAYIQFLAKNVGVGFDLEAQKRYATDTTFTYSGFTFSQILGENSILNDSIDADYILDTLGISSKNIRSAYLLPGYIQVAKIVDEMQDKAFQPFFGVRVYPTLVYSPFVFGGLDWKCAKWMRVGANVSYGGFAGLRGGLYASAKFSNYSIGLSTETISGLVSKKGSGQSLYVRFRCAF